MVKLVHTHFSTEASQISHNGYYSVTMLRCLWSLGLSHGWSASKALKKAKNARKGTFLWHSRLPNTVGNTDRLGSHFHKQILSFLNLQNPGKEARMNATPFVNTQNTPPNTYLNVKRCLIMAL